MSEHLDISKKITSQSSGPTTRAESERDRWDSRYRQIADQLEVSADLNVSQFLREIEELLPKSGRSLDVAGGAGDDAIFLAARGLDSTLLDISPVALELARSRAHSAGQVLNTELANTEADPLPLGPWDLIHISHYLHRPTIVAAISQLGPEGLLAISIATNQNLERHDRPPAEFLLDVGELSEIVSQAGYPVDIAPIDVVPIDTAPIEIVHFDEDWRNNGGHEAWLLARNPLIR